MSEYVRAPRVNYTISVDIQGPFPVPSNHGFLYNLAAVDVNDFSGYCWTMQLKAKGEAIARTIELLEVRVIRNEKGIFPVQLSSDRGRKFMSTELLDQLFLRQHDIEHTAAPPYTPQLNGSVERLNRTLIESVRCALHESGAPKWCWAEAIRSAVIVLNHTLVREGKTPIHRGFCPSFQAIRVITSDPQHQKTFCYRGSSE